MNRAFIYPAALLWLAVACAGALAQPTPPAGPKPDVNPFGSGLKGAPATAMPEDVEILRRLLDGAFAEAYGVSGRKPTTPLVQFRNIAAETYTPSPAGLGHPAPHTEGVYLKDYGVVYTTTLPSTGFGPLPASKAGAGDKAPPDDWDRIRKEIHGETPEPQGNVVPGHRPMSEVILKVLADNGRHFTDLADGERITVAVTFRGAVNCTNCHQNPWGNGGPGGLPMTFQYVPPGSPGTAGSAATQSPPGATDPNPVWNPPYTHTAIAPTREPPTVPAWLTEVRNAVLLGDLHLKQGKLQEAIATYKNASDQLSKGLTSTAGNAPDEALSAAGVQELLTAVDVFNKMAAAYVQVGDSDAAGKALKEAADLAKRAESLTGAPASANPAPPQPLPGKLVVSASKKLLDDVGAGKMTFEAFCKAATVEYTGSPVGSAPPAADPNVNTTGGK